MKIAKSVLIIIILLAGLIITLVLIKNPKIFKSKAGAEALNITTQDGQPVPQIEGRFKTSSERIRIGIQNLGGL